MLQSEGTYPCTEWKILLQQSPNRLTTLQVICYKLKDFMYTMVKLCLQLSRRGFQRPISHRLAMHTKHGQFRYNERILFYKKMRKEWIQVLCYKVKAHIHVQNGRYCCNKAPIDSPHLKSSLTKRRLHVHHGVTDFNEILSKLCHSENKITANARESPIPGDCGAAEG